MDGFSSAQPAGRGSSSLPPLQQPAASPSILSPSSASWHPRASGAGPRRTTVTGSPPAASSSGVDKGEIENQLFNETAPPVYSANSSSATPKAALRSASVVVPATTSRHADPDYPTAAAGCLPPLHEAYREKGVGDDARARQHRRPPHPAAPSRHRTRDASTRCDRGHRASFKRPPAGAPKFGRPFSSHPDINRMAASSGAVSNAFMDYDLHAAALADAGASVGSSTPAYANAGCREGGDADTFFAGAGYDGRAAVDGYGNRRVHHTQGALEANHANLKDAGPSSNVGGSPGRKVSLRETFMEGHADPYVPPHPASFSDSSYETGTSGGSDSRSSAFTRDSFGYPLYHPLFRQGTVGDYNDLDPNRGGGNGGGAASMSAMGTRNRASTTAAGRGGPRGAADADVGGGPGYDRQVSMPTTIDVPWDLRNMAEKEMASTFAFLSTRYFWFLIEYALRVTCIAMLIPAVLINLNLKYTPFASTTFALTSVVIAVGTNFGQSCVFFVQYIKGGCIWLPLATICVALKLNHYHAAWFVVYVAVLFLMAMFTEKTTRRMCLLLYNISMVSLLSGDEALLFPTRVLADWALGAAFALVATLIPYPMLATRFSAHITRTMFSNTATCFTGILSCFWAPSNTERSMSMVRIRSLVRTLDHLIEKFDSYDAFTFYEVLIYETSERREVRKEKVRLLLKLKMNLRSMERVVNMVQEKPQMIDLSERCLLLRDHLSVSMDDISRSMEALLWALSAAKKYEQLRTLGGYFETAGRAIKRLQTEFDLGRRVLFYEHQNYTMLQEGRMEEFVPLMTFFVFSIVNFWTTLSEFEAFIDRHEPRNDWTESLKLVWNAFIDPFVENKELIRLLCVRRAEPEVRVVIEAAKVSVAMLISVIFFYYVDNQSLLLTGPSIIAFVSGTNPVEAVQAGAARMSGTLIGAVLGFFAASLCKNAVDRVAALCVITFVMTFFRPGQKFGTICMYCNFVAVSGLAPTVQTAELTISRIQQNTFAIFIYCFISVAVFPVSPNHVLFKQRLKVMEKLNSTMQQLTTLFSEAAYSYTETQKDILRGAKTEDDVVTIGQYGEMNSRSDVTRPGFAPGQRLPTPENRINQSVRMLNGVTVNDSGAPGVCVMNGAFTMAPQDTVIEKIFTEIFLMLDVMKATSSVMPLAADEFQIIPHEYPQRASGDVHAALYRLCALVYTMACAWKTMREKGYFTTEMLHILHNLAPITHDIARCIDRFTHVMEFYVRYPSSGLSSELTKGTMQFRALCVELSVRKERDLIAVIRRTVMMKRVRDPEGSGEDNEVEGEGSDGWKGEGSGGSHGSGPPHSPRGGGGEGKNSHSSPHTTRKSSPEAGQSHSSHRDGNAPTKSTHQCSGHQHHHNHDKHRSAQRRDHHERGHRRSSPHDHHGRSTERQNGNHHSGPHASSSSRPTGNMSRSASAEAGLADRHTALPTPLLTPPEKKATIGETNTPLVEFPTMLHADTTVSVRSHDGALSATQLHESAPAASFSSTSISTFKDSVIPDLSSGDRFNLRPQPGDSTWLPIPATEAAFAPYDIHGTPKHLNPADGDGEDEMRSRDAHSDSPSSRDGDEGGIINTTRVFDSTVYPRPLTLGAGEDYFDGMGSVPLSARAELPPGATAVLFPFSDSPLPGQACRAVEGAGIEEDRCQHLQHHRHREAKISSKSRLVAHEESPAAAAASTNAVRKPSMLMRVDRLRDHLRGVQRQGSSGCLPRVHSSFEVRTYGASYTNIAGLDSSLTLHAHNPTQHGHQKQHGRHNTHHAQQQQHRSQPARHAHDTHRIPGQSSSSLLGEERGSPNGTYSSPYASGNHVAPYGSPDTQPVTPLEKSVFDAAGEDLEVPIAGELTVHALRATQDANADKSVDAGNRTEDATPGNAIHHASQDRITLRQSSSDGEEERHGRVGGRLAHRRSSSSDSATSVSRSHIEGSSDSKDSDCESCSSSSSSGSSASDESASASLVRFNDSFTTPITVQDAEGLHAFTLSLEIYGKELRRVLYGLEEMLQSL